MKKVFLFYSFVVFLAWISLGCSQKEKTVNAPEVNFALHGYVRHSVTGEKVPDVIVSVAGQVCTTNTAGYYYFIDVPAGSYHLTAEKYGDILFETDISIDRTQQYDFKVNYDISLYGWVTHPVDGPIAGASIQAGDSTAISTISGYYEFVGLSTGTYAINCEKEGYLQLDTNVTIDADFTIARIKMTRSFAQVHGIVSHPEDGPIGGAIVQLDTLFDTTTANGAYQFDSVAIGVHHIDCEITGYSPIDTDFNVDKDNFELNLTPNRIYSFSGDIYHIEDGALKDATVTLGSYSAVTDDQGHFDIEGILRGSYDLTVEKAGYEAYSASGVSVDSDIQVDIRLYKYVTQEWLIEEDTYVGITQFEWNYEPTYYLPAEGQAESLLLDCGIISVAPHTAEMWQTRMFLNIPSINCMGWDETYSFKLLLFSASDWDINNYNNCIILHSISEPWNEDEITWENQPAVNEPELGCVELPQADINDSVLIDLTDYVCGNFVDAFGLRLSYGWDQNYNEFYSSEAADASKRPRLIGTYRY